MPWIPAAMHDREDNDLVVDRAKVHGVRKPTDERSPYVALHAGTGHGILKNGRERCFDRRGEGGAQTDTLCLVPTSSIE
jgi:hypothetical protein